MTTSVWLTCLGLILLPQADATRLVTGTVADARSRQPLPDVVVTVEGQNSEVRTDTNGRFSIATPAGAVTVRAALVGYVVGRHSIGAGGATEPIEILLQEGTGVLGEQVTVSATADDGLERAAASTLHSRDLQALRGVTLDDPVRAVQAIPSVSATDDFYSEFAIRGSPFRHVGLIVDGIQTRHLMHAVHGVTDGGSIAMLNTDAVGRATLIAGGSDPLFGHHLGSRLELTVREGSRDRRRLRAGLSGTSATMLAEGPLAASRGAWLVSARRSYLDLLLERIDSESSLAFGFTDVTAKLVRDLGTVHRVEVLSIYGTSAFDEASDALGPNDQAAIDGRSWLSSLTWTMTPSPRWSLSQKVFATGLRYEGVNAEGRALDRHRAAEMGWRVEAVAAIHPRFAMTVGGDVQRHNQRHRRTRTFDNATVESTLEDYDVRGMSSSAFARGDLQIGPRIMVSSGGRLDSWGPASQRTSSPWVRMNLRASPGTHVTVSAGAHAQFAELDQIYGINGGGTDLAPESSRHLDVGISRDIGRGLSLRLAAYARNEDAGLWMPDAEPRREPGGAVVFGRGDARWTNSLDGRARGIEAVLRRDAPTGLSGWIGYAFGSARYTREDTGESFDADHDQRHGLSAFGYYRLSSRSAFSGKCRYGSNYPLRGFIVEQPPVPGSPPLLGGGRPVSYALSDRRNTLRLPPYARLDLRVDRTFGWAARRWTLFVEVANVLNRTNVRNVPYETNASGRVSEPTDSMLPVLPSAGIMVDF